MSDNGVCVEERRRREEREKRRKEGREREREKLGAIYIEPATKLRCQKRG